MSKWLSEVAAMWPQVRLVDVLDILVLAYAIYRGLLLVRGTRGEQLAKGVGVLLVVYVITQPLRTVHWLMQSLVIPGVLVMVIIFQPELRMALERVGRSGPFGFRARLVPGERMTEVINEIVEAVARFARQRIGALIVIEREVALQDVARTGVPMDAELTAPLLDSVFFHGGPLHDGAVLVRGDRVAAAGCLLPTTTTPAVGRGLGLRHLAAIGMSERSDAVVVVVSEETGQVSLGADGALERGLDPADLKGALLTYFAPPPRARWFSLLFGGRG